MKNKENNFIYKVIQIIVTSLFLIGLCFIVMLLPNLNGKPNHYSFEEKITNEIKTQYVDTLIMNNP